MADKIVALVGGDSREIQVVPALKAAGWKVQVFGLPVDVLPAGVVCCNSVKEAVRGACAIFLPLPGVRNNGQLHAPFLQTCLVNKDDFKEVPVGTPVIVGVASDFLKQLLEELNLPIIEIAETDSIAIPNAIPTAEGAIQVAMEHTQITIDGMRCFVIGFGRVGEALASRLRALGARVTVTNRGAGRFAAAAKEGYHIFPWQSLADGLAKVDVVFNTVPAMVLDREKLSAMDKDTLIIDLATMPGGTDFPAAKDLGIQAIHALSLPGKVAPVSAGRVLAGVYPRIANLIWENLSELNQTEIGGAFLERY